MYNLVQIEPQLIRNSVIWSALPGRIRLVALALVCFGISQASRAVSPAPDGGYANGNTAEGTDALLTLTTGSNNTAIGAFALGINTTGSDNTATGSGALISNRTGSDNTATGSLALYNNTASDNTATGFNALLSNTAGTLNTADGVGALAENTTGNDNTATGVDALLNNTTGFENTATGGFALEQNNANDNTATGYQALRFNITGSNNTATGFAALANNRAGHDNIAEGFQALLHSTGSSNIGLGSNAGANLTTGNNNIDIGANVLGNAGEANTIRIGKQGTQKNTLVAGIFGTAVSGSTVVVNSSGKLGVATSSARFKDAIKPMEKASAAILALKPVTFRYKQEIDPDRVPQFGLIAEDVEKVDPDLVTRDESGKPVTVRYEAVNAMLLNEFLKARRELDEEKVTVAQQQKQIEVLTAGLKAEADQIQKVNAQLKLSKLAPTLIAETH